MTNVVSLRRTKEDLKERAIEEIRNNPNTYQFFISYPENEEGKVFFYTNFDPGVNEIFALDTLLDYLKHSAYTIVEDDS